MSFELFMVLTFFAMAILCVGQTARALQTGVWTHRKMVYRRDSDPPEYWFYTIWTTASVPLFLFGTVAAYTGDHQIHLRLFAVIIVSLIAFWLVRGLQTGRIGMAEAQFERRLDPGEYWAFAGVHVAAIIFFGWLFVGGVA